MNETIRMQLSAFVDGELPENEAELLLRRMSQDGELRQQVAEYLAIGRAMRGEVQVAGIDSLRARVASELGEFPVREDVEPETGAERSYVRPMLGFAVAATVALVAIFGLGQLTDVNGVDTPSTQVADEGEFPTQPEVDDLVEQLRQMHDATTDQPYEAMLTTVVTEEDVEIGTDESDDASSDETDEDEPEVSPAE